MQIGTFRETKDGTFSGEITAFGIRQSVGIVPVVFARKHGRSPDYVVTNDDGIEFGVAWKRVSKQGKAYLSVSLDSPTFPQPFNCALITDEVSHKLLWNRYVQDEKEGSTSNEGPIVLGKFQRNRDGSFVGYIDVPRHIGNDGRLHCLMVQDQPELGAGGSFMQMIQINTMD